MTLLDTGPHGGPISRATHDGEAIARELAALLNRAETAGVEVWPVVDREGTECGVTWECVSGRAGMLVAWNPDGWNVTAFTRVEDDFADA